MASVTFQEFQIPAARHYADATLPYGLSVQTPSGTPPPLDASVNALHAYAASGQLKGLLRKHGAVLFRGFGNPGAETFAALVNVAGREMKHEPFEQIGLAGKRTIVAENVWTANEGSPKTTFYQHNEYSRYTRFPAFIHFYCVKKAPTGGATPIANSAHILIRIQSELPDFLSKIHSTGLAMKMLFKPPGCETAENPFTWAGPFSFGQTLTPGDAPEVVQQKIEEQVRRLTGDFKWLEDGSLELVQRIPGVRRETGGKGVWFNGLVGRFGMTRDKGALDPPYVGVDGMTYLPCAYGDDTEIPREYLEKLYDITKEEEIYITLEPGDLLLVDNFQVSHGREPWEGDRLILVSMWDSDEKIQAY